MKKKVITLIMLGMILSSTSVFAQENTSIPTKIQKKVEQNIEESKNELKEIKAWETDVNGNLIEVTPKSDTFKTRMPPSNGYRYLFNKYYSSTNNKNYRFSQVGTYRISNGTSSAISATYTQQSDVQTSWNVSSNVSAEATIGNSFIGEIKAKVGGSVDRTKTWKTGTTISTSYTVPSKTVVYLTNYQVGVYSSGTLTWSKYDAASGANVGTYTETANGTAVSTSDVNIELTQSSSF